MKTSVRAILTQAIVTSVLLLAPQAAQAQDAGYDWGGFYLGVNGGYGWGNDTVTESDLTTILVDDVLSMDEAGALGGIQAGYNWQLDPSLLLGWETDFDIGSLEGHGALVTTDGSTTQRINFTADSTLEWLGTTRARAGFAAGNLLFYGTGGLAYGGVRRHGKIYAASVPSGSQCENTCYDLSSSKTDIGWALGVGVELAVTDNVTLRAEYQRVDFGTQKLETPSVGFSAGTGVFAYDNAYDVVRLGLNVKY